VTRRQAGDAGASGDDRFPLTRLAEVAIEETAEDRSVGAADASRPMIDLARARDVLAAVKLRIGTDETSLKPLVPAIEIEIAIAAAESGADNPDLAEDFDPLFRLRTQRWAMDDSDFAGLVPLRDPRLRVLEFDYGVSGFIGVLTIADLPASPTARRSYIVASCSNGQRGDPLVVDGMTARILKLSDGTRTAKEIVGELDRRADLATVASSLKWIEGLFVQGLISLHDKPLDPMRQALPRGVDATRHSESSPQTRPPVQRKVNRRSRTPNGVAVGRARKDRQYR
jgi:hypothetical protein